jgi:ketosteroid isomerase-like protein
MSATDNKRLMQNIFSELSEGNLGPLVEAMAEDVQWTWMGTTRWSKTFKGKESVVGELLGAVKSTLAEPFRVVAHCFIAEGDYVVVESRGQNATPDGRTYNNSYCWVCRIAGGKLRELREYMDTELVTATFHRDGNLDLQQTNQ